MNNIDQGYLDLLNDIINNGHKKGDRTGTGTISVFGRQIRHDMSLGFPLLTTKRIPFNLIKSELKWFLKGSTDIRDLWKDNNHIWDGDWYKKYKSSTSSPYSLDEMIKSGLEDTPNYFHKSIWSLGPIYGKQWRNWEIYNNDYNGPPYKDIDQIQKVMDDLQNNPDSRRIMVNAWNVGELNQMTLPPCHYGFQFWTRELSEGERFTYYKNIHSKESQKMFNLLTFDHSYFDEVGVPKRTVSLMWNQRSVDTPLGLPFNIASYALLLEMMASEINMVAVELIGNLGDVHIYNNQINGVLNQLERGIGNLPQIKIADGMYSSLDPTSKDVILENYNPQSKIPIIKLK